MIGPLCFSTPHRRLADPRGAPSKPMYAFIFNAETCDSASKHIWEGHPGSGQLSGSVVLLKTRLSILPSLLVHVPLWGRRPPMGDGKSKWPKHSPLSKFNSDPSPSPIYLCLLFARICSDNILRRTRYTTCCADLLTSHPGVGGATRSHPLDTSIKVIDTQNRAILNLEIATLHRAKRCAKCATFFSNPTTGAKVMTISSFDLSDTTHCGYLCL